MQRTKLIILSFLRLAHAIPLNSNAKSSDGLTCSIVLLLLVVLLIALLVFKKLFMIKRSESLRFAPRLSGDKKLDGFRIFGSFDFLGKKDNGGFLVGFFGSPASETKLTLEIYGMNRQGCTTTTKSQSYSSIYQTPDNTINPLEHDSSLSSTDTCYCPRPSNTDLPPEIPDTLGFRKAVVRPEQSLSPLKLNKFRRCSLPSSYYSKVGGRTEKQLYSHSRKYISLGGIKEIPHPARTDSNSMKTISVNSMTSSSLDLQRDIQSPQRREVYCLNEDTSETQVYTRNSENTVPSSPLIQKISSEAVAQFRNSTDFNNGNTSLTLSGYVLSTTSGKLNISSKNNGDDISILSPVKDHPSMGAQECVPSPILNNGVVAAYKLRQIGKVNSVKRSRSPTIGPSPLRCMMLPDSSSKDTIFDLSQPSAGKGPKGEVTRNHDNNNIFGLINELVEEASKWDTSIYLDEKFQAMIGPSASG